MADFSFIDQNQFSDLEMNFQTIIGSYFSQQLSSEFSVDVVGNLNHATGDNMFQISSVPAIQFGGAATSAHHHHHHQQVQSKVGAAKAEIETKKRKTEDVSHSGSACKNSPRKGKKVKINGEEEEKLEREVIHVRARRGQATDTHSLAERVRRGKINERLRCLQDIVPGCYKTMGMALMLDEIITYVQSMHNQIEFLSMKLTAASSLYGFNSDSNAIQMMQGAKAGETQQEMERLIREGYGGGGAL